MQKKQPQRGGSLTEIHCLICQKPSIFTGKNPRCCLGDVAYDSFVASQFSSRDELKDYLSQTWQDWPGVGHTPLVDLAIGPLAGRRIFGKAEHRNPSGSFKDRESETALNMAKAQNTHEVAVISSGNAAVSAAAFARQLKIHCRVFIPEKTSVDKQAALTKTGATISLLPGVFEDVYRAALTLPEEIYHVSAGQNPFRELGSSEIAVEIAHELGQPDHVLVPAGNGLLLWGIYTGFLRLQKAGTIATLPKIHAVQIEDAAPLATALQQGEEWVMLPDIPDSIAEGIVAQESYCAPKALRALRATGGTVLTVTDDDIRRWEPIVAKRVDLDLEETSLTVFPALEKLAVPIGQTVVAILTGCRIKPHLG